MLQATRRRYQPPSRKNCQDLVLTMRAKADNTTTKLIIDLRKNNVLPYFSGKLIYFNIHTIIWLCYCKSVRAYMFVVHMLLVLVLLVFVLAGWSWR